MKRACTVFLFSVCVLLMHAQDVDSVMHVIDTYNDRPEMALDILNQALEDNPASEELLKVRADVYENLKQFDKAVEDYKQLTRLSPDDETFWYLLGRNQFFNGDLQDAMRSLNRSTRLNSRYLPAFHTKTEVLLQLGQYDAALRVSDSTLRIAGTARTYFLQGEVNSRLGAWQIAEWAYSSAVRIDKGFIEAYIALANITANQNKAAETLEHAEAALAIDPDSKEALIARSRGFALRNDYYNAIEDISYVLEIYPDDVEARFWRARYFNSSNRPQDAIRDFDHLLRLEPQNWHAIAGRADAYAKTGNKAVAQEGYEKLLEIAANFPESNTIIEFANTQIFELHRENQPPVLTLTEPENENFEIIVDENLRSITIRGIIQDDSPLKSLIINGQNTTFVVIDDHWEFVALMALENVEEIMIEVTDLYDNVTQAKYKIVKNEE